MGQAATAKTLDRADPDSGARALDRYGSASDAPKDLAPHVAAVESARWQLARDLDRLTLDVRAQMTQTMEKTVWRLAATAAAIVAGVAARQALTVIWRRARHADPPDDPTAPEVRWGDAVGWSLASGVGVGLAKVLAARATAAGWRRAAARSR